MPLIKSNPRGMGSRVVTEFVDSVGTTSVTFSIPDNIEQDTLTVYNISPVELLVSVGTQANVSVPSYREVVLNETYTSFNIRSSFGVGGFRATCSYQDVDEEDEQALNTKVKDLTTLMGAKANQSDVATLTTQLAQSAKKLNAVAYVEVFDHLVSNGNWVPAIQAAHDSLTIGGLIVLPTKMMVLKDIGQTYLLNFSKPIIFEGRGFYSQMLIDPSVPNNVDIIRFSPNMNFGGTHVEFRNFSILPQSGTPARHGIFIDIDSADQYIDKMKVDNVFIRTKVGKAFRAENPIAVNGGLFTSVIENSTFDGGIDFEGVGDSITVRKNTITGKNIGVRVNLVGGASLPVIDDNNITSRGGAVLIKQAMSPKITNNNIEQLVPIEVDWAGDTAQACIDFRGLSTNRINMGKAKDNHIGVFTGAGAKCISLDYTDDADIDNNEIITDTGGDGIRVTANSKRTYIGKKNNITGPANPINDIGEGTSGVMRTPTLLNNWAEFNSAYYSKSGYYKDRDGWVHLKGLLKDGVSTPNTIVYTLPVGFRPNRITPFFTITDASGTLGIAELKVTETGDLVIVSSGGNTRLSLDGIKFLAEQ